MNDEQLLGHLRRDMDRATAGHHLDPDAVGRALASAAGRPPTTAASRWAVAAAVVLVAALTVVLAVVVPSRGSTGAPAGGACADVTRSPLPTWARGGFSPGAYSVPHVMGERGRIVAILFTGHLYSPARTDPHNKILWVVHGGWFAPFVIRAHLAGSHTTVRRVLVNGPGPSYVDLPAPGCWQLSLRWGNAHDSLSLRYVDGRLPH